MTGPRARASFEECLADLQQAPKHWLVTGAAGFIGSHLIEALLRNGQRVTGMDDFSTGRRENLEIVRRALRDDAAWSRFSFYEASIRDFEACRSAAAGVDRILHQAALGSVPRSIERPLDTHLSNVDGTLHVFLAAIEQRVPRVVYASSSSVYGDEATLPKVESRIGRPLSPYAASKRMNEVYADTLARTHGISAIGLRYFNVVGARQDPEGPYAAVVPRWLAALARGERPVIFGDGETTRDFCPVRNVVAANLLAATAQAALDGRVYNIALGGQTSLNELFAILRDGLAARGRACAGIEPLYQDFRPGDIRHSLADISQAERDFGYAPVVGLRDGLEDAITQHARGPEGR